MARVARAQTEQKSASLSTEFGYNYAVRLFGQETIDALPVITRGPNKGKPKGYVLWLRTTMGGYSDYTGGGVAAGRTVRAWIGAGMYTSQNDAVIGEWLGRKQSICGSECYLGPQNRDQALVEREAEQVARQAEWEQMKAERIT